MGNEMQGGLQGRYWRRKPESNRRTRICNPLHNHSAIAPVLQEKRKRGVGRCFLFVFGAGDESRTRDLNLGKVALYQLSYSRGGTAFWCVAGIAADTSTRSERARVHQRQRLYTVFRTCAGSALFYRKKPPRHRARCRRAGLARAWRVHCRSWLASSIAVHPLRFDPCAFRIGSRATKSCRYDAMLRRAWLLRALPGSAAGEGGR